MNKSTLRRKQQITLIEILIVITILTMVMGVVGVNVVKMVEQERFRAGVRRLSEKLQVAQDLMLILNTDVKVNLKAEDGTLSFVYEVEQPLQGRVARMLLKPEKIRGIQAITFHDMEQDIELEEELQLRFLSGGSSMSRGVLHCYAGTRRRWKQTVILRGFPHSIGGFHEVSEELELKEEEDEVYPKEILEEETPSIPSA